MLAGLAGQKVTKIFSAVVGSNVFKNRFDTDKKILHNLTSLLMTKQRQATGSESKVK